MGNSPVSFIKIHKLIFFINLIIIYSFSFISSPLASDLHWSPVESTDNCIIAGYIIHYGVASGQYTHEIDMGNSTVCNLDELGLIASQSYRFAVNAYSSTGHEGPLSAPVDYFTSQNTDVDNSGIPDDNTSQNTDVDNSGIPDDWEAYYEITSVFLDPDSDGLYNRLEYLLGTNPIDSDTDDDGLPDGIEVQTHRNPLVYDTSEIFNNYQLPILFIPSVDAEYYLKMKLAALQIVDSAWLDIDIVSLEILLLGYGLTAETHYSKWGYKEGLAPNAYFNHSEYILAKATAMYNSGLYSSILEAQNAFKNAWPYDAYLHYIQYGAAEGINPSNSFDESAYFADKLAAFQAGGGDWDDKTIDDLRNIFIFYGLTVIDHYLLYGQYEGLTPSPVVSTP